MLLTLLHLQPDGREYSARQHPDLRVSRSLQCLGDWLPALQAMTPAQRKQLLLLSRADIGCKQWAKLGPGLRSYLEPCCLRRSSGELYLESPELRATLQVDCSLCMVYARGGQLISKHHKQPAVTETWTYVIDRPA